VIARLLLFFAVFLFASAARAERCGDEARAWIDRCSKSTGVAFTLASCPPSVAILSTPELRIEVSTSDKAFLRAGEFGLSPIGEFADWKLEPEPRRRALEAAAQCVKSEAPTALLTGETPASGHVEPRAPKPWLALAGALLALLACVRRARPALLALAAVAGVFFLRQAIQPFVFFHQNGQGAQWVDFAAHGDTSEYGPGYPELFGWVAQGARPDRGVALLQGILAATIPLSVYAIARAAGAARSTAMVLGAAMAFDPVFVRVARSESYFSAMAALLFAAAAVLAWTDRLRGWSSRAGLLAGALLVAEAARIHPLAWVPSALVPLVLLCRPGRARDRVRRTAIAAAVIAVVAAPLVLPSMRNTLHGHLGVGFLPGARAALGRTWLVVAVAVSIATVLAARAPRIGVRAWVLVVVSSVAFATNVLAHDSKVVHAAHLHLYLPALIAAVSAVQPAIALSVLAMVHVVTEGPLRALPTDALELQWAMQWREELPPRATVGALQRAGDRLLILPFTGEGLPVAVPLESAPTYYYRSSLCFTPEGAPECVMFESTHKLRPIAVRRLPSIASLPWAPMPEGELEVGLFVVE
jgi:hypothetical protein